ncbi:MAG: hypothetical protein JSW23_12060 [Planctomycetota bacterium]|nr:MAG: hypothetical protein JSW23_12060 [Planctomycetota bacterium]
MSLVRWFRKNNKKIMAIVVIVIMVGFIGGSYIQQLSRRAGGRHQAVAYFADDRPMTNYDLALARRDLEILKMLSADTMLRSLTDPLFRARDLHAAVLGELLFADRTTSPAFLSHIKQVINTNQYPITDKQINDIYNRTMGSDVYWFLLKNEVGHTGVKVSNDFSGTQLARNIPRITGGAATYQQLMHAIVNRHGLAEKDILTTFSELMAVLNYAKIVCGTEDITASQLRHNIKWESERMDLEFVQFDSAVFAESQPEPAQDEVSAHFEKFKKYFPTEVTEQNPYGFGYKLPDRVRLEYIAVRLDDVSAIVTRPTNDEAQEYYQRNAEQLFTEQVPLDPNDPNSMTIDRTKTYAEVAGTILKGLHHRKINSRAEKILQDAKTLTEAALQDLDTDFTALTSEQFEQLAGDYETAADLLSEKYKLKVYAGETGWLGAADMQTDKNLGSLYIAGYGYSPLPLTRIVFALDELGVSELGPFDIQRPMLYQNIGPLVDISGRMAGEISGRIMALVRVIEAQKAAEPDSIDRSFSTDTLVLEQTPDETDRQKVYSVREKVVEDLKKLAAMETTKSRADEFLDLAAKDDWHSAVDKFNELYGREDDQDDNSAQTFRVQNFTNLRRIPPPVLKSLAVQTEGDPAAHVLLNERKRESILRDRIYSLIPPDSNTPETMPVVLELKPNMSYYCLKDVVLKRPYREDYETIKAMRAHKENFVRSQSLAPVHFNPENVLKRMSFRLITRDEGPADANVPPQAEAEL